MRTRGAYGCARPHLGGERWRSPLVECQLNVCPFIMLFQYSLRLNATVWHFNCDIWVKWGCGAKT